MMINKSINIFDIFSTADKELVHSSMMKFFLENFTEQTLEFLEFKDSKQNINVKLEYSDKVLKKEGGKKDKVRLDVIGREESGQIVLIIENKFKAVPTQDQLELYDTYFSEKKLSEVHKVLVVFSTAQLSSKVSDYCKSHNWVVKSYISLNHNEDSTIIDFMKNLNQSFNNNVETLIIDDYKSYLKKYENAVRKLAEKNIYQYFKNNENNSIGIESNSNRFIYFQYMLYLQAAISKKLNAKPNFKVDPSNDGGKNVVPSVAFWREAGNSYKGLISSAYAGIDGSTFKLGIYYSRERIAKISPIIQNFKQVINQSFESYKALQLVTRSRQLKNIDDKKPNKTESVHTIFTFQIEKGSDKEVVIEEFSEAIGKYFSLFD